MDVINELVEAAREAAIKGGQVIMDVYHSGCLHTQMKEDQSPLTKADRAAHEVITQVLKTTRLPLLSEEDSQIGYETRKDWDYFFLIDPLDGTKEFIKRNGEFTVNIAVIKGKQVAGGVVYAPDTELLFVAGAEGNVYKKVKGVQSPISVLPQRMTLEELKRKSEVRIVVSRSHLSEATLQFCRQFPNVKYIERGSSLKLLMLAEGEADLYPRLGPTMEWDTAAAHAILNAANRGIYQLDSGKELTYNKPDQHNPFFVAY